MVGKNEESENQTKVSSRRNFFSYMKQIVAGASVAGVTLELLHSKDAASGMKSTNPQAIPCDGCQITNCGFSLDCSESGYDATYYVMTYTITSGIAPQCRDDGYVICVTSCNYNPC